MYKVQLSHYLKIVMGESGGKPLLQRAWGMCPQGVWGGNKAPAFLR